MLLVVYEGGLSEKIDVRYTVTPQKTPDYIDLAESDAFVRIDASRFVDIPQNGFLYFRQQFFFVFRQAPYIAA